MDGNIRIERSKRGYGIRCSVRKDQLTTRRDA